jgi:hypothetical protein
MIKTLTKVGTAAGAIHRDVRVAHGGGPDRAERRDRCA